MGVSNFLAVAEWILFCRLVLGEELAAVSKRRIPGYIGTMVFIILISINNWGLLVPLFMLYVIFVFFQLRVWDGVKVWVLAFLFISIMEMGVGHLIKNFMGNASIELEQLLCEGILAVLFAAYYLLAVEKPRRRVEQLSNFIWGITVSILLALQIMMVYFLRILQGGTHAESTRAGAFVVVFGIAAICGMVSLCIYYSNHAKNYRLQNEFAEKYNGQQKEYFSRLLEREQDTRKFRHDIINHLISMKGLAERKEYEALESYLGELLQEINVISKRQYDVGNDFVNTIVNYYFLPIQEECEIIVSGYMGEFKGMLQTDLCILISNLVKNAVEAQGHVDREKRKITFYASQGKKYLNIRIENTVSHMVTFGEDGLPMTGKEDKKNHGLGVLNVKRTVEKYGGIFEIRMEDERFVAEVYLKI